MSKKENKADTDAKSHKGQFLVRVIVEVLGAPKEHIEKAIGMLVDRMHDDDDFEVVSEETFEATERGKLFSTFSELEIWFKDLETIEKFMFDYTPSSIEIMDPGDFTIKSSMFSGIMNDFLLKMHQTALEFKDLSANSSVLAKNTDAVIRNFLNHLCEEPRSSADIAKITGIPSQNIGAILAKFEKLDVIRKDGDLWVKKDKDE